VERQINASWWLGLAHYGEKRGAGLTTALRVIIQAQRLAVSNWNPAVTEFIKQRIKIV